MMSIFSERYYGQTPDSTAGIVNLTRIFAEVSRKVGY
jgi:hypothetical protein